jgi:hypothetical protein
VQQVQRPRFAVWEVAAVLAGLTVLLLIMVNRYGPHRDELYFVSAGQRLAWGYPDQPVFTPLLARLATEVAPHNLLALRLPSLIAMALLVICGVAFARLLGGGRAAQVLTATTVAASVITVTLGHRLSTATFDTLAWAAVLLVVGYALHDERPQLWLIAGLLAGLGLNNKTAVVVLLFAIFLGVLLVPGCRRQLGTAYPWLGGLIALLLWLPNLSWQLRNGWPVLALGADIAEEYGGVIGRLELIGLALVMFSPLIASPAVPRPGLGEITADRGGIPCFDGSLPPHRREGLLPGRGDRSTSGSRLHGAGRTLVCSTTHRSRCGSGRIRRSRVAVLHTGPASAHVRDVLLSSAGLRPVGDDRLARVRRLRTRNAELAASRPAGHGSRVCQELRGGRCH